MNSNENPTRNLVLRAAVQIFADRGYAGASVQDIVDAAKVTKPTLYYYFGSKEGLFKALVDHGFEERYRLMREATVGGGSIESLLVNLTAGLFEFYSTNRELMRITFTSFFAAEGELPAGLRSRDKGRRSFEFIQDLIAKAQTRGELAASFTADELTMGIFGQINLSMMIHLLEPTRPLTRLHAERVVKLFLAGAQPAKVTPKR